MLSDLYDLCDPVVGLLFAEKYICTRLEGLRRVRFPFPYICLPACLRNPSCASRSGRLYACNAIDQLQSQPYPISGGGIGGLTLALALSAYPDIQVDMYERAAQYTEVGAGVGMWWRPRRVLATMGLEADLAPIVGRFQDARSQSLNYSIHIID